MTPSDASGCAVLTYLPYANVGTGLRRFLSKVSIELPKTESWERTFDLLSTNYNPVAHLEGVTVIDSVK